MDRINIKCIITGREVNLQLDKKAMPGEPGPCYMITESGCFKGYITRQKSGDYKCIATSYYSNEELQIIDEYLKKVT